MRPPSPPAHRHHHSGGGKFPGPSPGSSSNPKFVTLMGRDPICNAAISRLPLASPFLCPQNQELPKNRALGRGFRKVGTRQPQSKGEEPGEDTTTCLGDHTRKGQPGSLASGRGRVPRQLDTLGAGGGAWEAALNVLEVLGSSQPRPTGKCTASLSREKPASWGRSKGRQGRPSVLSSQLLDLPPRDTEVHP